MTRPGPTSELGWLSLDPGEEVLWDGQPRIQTVVPAALGGGVLALVIVVAVVADVLPALALAAVPVAAVPALVQYLRVRRTRFVVTSDAVYERHGILGVRVTRLRLDRVQNSASSQHALGRLIGYGTVTVDSAGGGDVEIRFWNVEEPTRVRALVDRQRRDATDGVPGTVEQWEAILEEVRRWRTAVERDGESTSR